MTRPRVTIVTPSLDQAAYLPRTIESVLSQEGDFDLEYLVVDGGSTDGTAEILRRYAGRLVATSGPDAGQADAVNKGLRAATGEIVGWVNSDDLLLPGAIQAAVEAFRDHPETGWLHGRCRIVDEQDRPIRRWVAAYKDRACRRHTHDRLLVQNYVSQPAVFWRRALMERVGHLDTSLHYTFDYDLWLRFSALGPPLFLERELAAFRWYPTSKSGAGYARQFEEDERVALRHGPSAWVRARKRVKTAQIVLAYRLMALVSGRAGG
jgi:glycosyltransferase involved in cell wall biosynthesis